MDNNDTITISKTSEYLREIADSRIMSPEARKAAKEAVMVIEALRALTGVGWQQHPDDLTKKIVETYK